MCAIQNLPVYVLVRGVLTRETNNGKDERCLYWEVKLVFVSDESVESNYKLKGTQYLLLRFITILLSVQGLICG